MSNLYIVILLRALDDQITYFFYKAATTNYWYPDGVNTRSVSSEKVNLDSNASSGNITKSAFDDDTKDF
jgi:hypothetical protein